MARALELKRMLTNVRKSDSQIIDAYLHEIKTIVNNLAPVNQPISPSDLVHYIVYTYGPWKGL